MKKVYGPYTRKDGRKHVIHYDTETKKRITQSYPRYLMEQASGIKIPSNEDVDHVNDDFTDDRLENYQLLSRQENNVKARQFYGTEQQLISFICPKCGKEFQAKAGRVGHNQGKQGKSGPYCSKRCAGLVGK